jgi:ABC-type glycerol-3-phosphate transport system permease component
MSDMAKKKKGFWDRFWNRSKDYFRKNFWTNVKISLVVMVFSIVVAALLSVGMDMAQAQIKFPLPKYFFDIFIAVYITALFYFFNPSER